MATHHCPAQYANSMRQEGQPEMAIQGQPPDDNPFRCTSIGQASNWHAAHMIPADLRVRNDTMKHDVASSDIAALQ